LWLVRYGSSDFACEGPQADPQHGCLSSRTRNLDLKLDFVKPDVTYEVTLYEDTADSHYQFPGGWNKRDAAKKKMPFKPVATKRELYQVRKMTIAKGDAISSTIAPGGGCSMWIRPQR